MMAGQIRRRRLLFWALGSLPWWLGSRWQRCSEDKEAKGTAEKMQGCGCLEVIDADACLRTGLWMTVRRCGSDLNCDWGHTQQRPQDSAVLGVSIA